MKVSAITTQLVAEYLKLNYSTMTTAEKTELTAILDAAKSYLKSYTGHVDETATGEELYTDDNLTFYTLFTPIVKDTLKLYSGEDEITDGFTVDYSEGSITFDEEQSTITADYTAGIDAFEDFTIAVYVLCQDMYDNRSMYVDNANVNRVVESILGMHSVNLL